MDREEVIRIMGNEIRKIFGSIYYPFVIEDDTFDKLKELAAYTDELLEDSVIREEYEKQLRKTEKDEELIKVKLETFAIIRNVLIHFPYYRKWDDVFVTPELLTWNKKKSTVKHFFDKYKGKEIKYDVYIRDGSDGWQFAHSLKIVVPELKPGQKTYFKDFMSMEDAFWTFCLIDSLLEYLNIDVLTFSHYSV